jgi:serine/threonine protein phosphatase PrpC
MRHDADTDVPSTGHAECDRVVRESRQCLVERGETIVGSGCFRSGSVCGALHTDFGPKDQDKGTNQDYILAWRPRAAKTRGDVRCAIALGDGLTTSFRSEYASALACWVALRAVVDADPTTAPKTLAGNAFNAAGLAIGRLADELGGDPQASCPPGQFLSTWKYILRKGALFQTTLTLAWLDQDAMYVAMVGDGGALWRSYEGNRKGTDRVLAACDLDSQHVYALGPTERCVQEFDCWREEKLNGPFLCALHTDGVGRGLGSDPLVLLDELENLQAEGEENAARRFIEQAIEQRPKEYGDNLTLAVIQAD